MNFFLLVGKKFLNQFLIHIPWYPLEKINNLATINITSGEGIVFHVKKVSLNIYYKLLNLKKINIFINSARWAAEGGPRGRAALTGRTGSGRQHFSPFLLPFHRRLPFSSLAVCFHFSAAHFYGGDHFYGGFPPLCSHFHRWKGGVAHFPTLFSLPPFPTSCHCFRQIFRAVFHSCCQPGFCWVTEKRSKINKNLGKYSKTITSVWAAFIW